MDSDSRIKILHIDDEEGVLTITKKILEKIDESFNVISTGDHLEALEKVRSGEIDCVVSDFKMPLIDGIELATKVKEIVNIPFILYTGHGSDEVAFKAFSAGVDDYLKKEFDIGHYQVLAQRIRQAVNKEKTKKALKKSETLLDAFIDSIPYSMFLFDKNLNMVKFNEYGAKAMNLDPNEEVGWNILEKYPGLVGTGRYDKYKAVLETGETMEESIVEYEEDGRRRYLVRRAFRVEDHLGITSMDISKQMVIQGSLQRQEAEYRDLVDMLPQIIFEMDTDGKITYLNTMSLTLLGITVEDLKNDRYLSKIFTPEDRETGVEKFKKLLEGSIPPDRFQFELINSEGKRVPAEFYIKLNEARSTISGLRGIIVNISEKVEAERELRRSEKNLRTMLDTSPYAVFLLDDGVIKYVNKQTLTILGYNDPDELVEREITELIPVEYRQKSKEIRYLRNRDDYSQNKYEMGYYHKNGSIIEAENNIARVEMNGKRVTLVFAREIGVYKKMINELGEREEKFRRLFEQSNDMIIIHSNKEGILDVNKRVTDILGFSREELLKMHIRDLPASDIPQSKTMGAVQTAETAGNVRLTTKFRTKNGDSIHVDVSSSLIDPERGIIQGIVRDITGYKELEEELRQHSDELEEIVKEKTGELLEAEKMVTAGRVAAMIAHDLKGPLQTIATSIYLLESDPDSMESMISMIRSSVNRANSMIEEFRSRTRDTPVDLKEIDLEDLIKQTIKEIKTPDWIDISLNTENVNMVVLDANKMRRVLDNLVGNAIEAMPKAGEVNITAKNIDSYIIIKIADTGVGIPEETKARLFQPFVTLKSTGLGLGLAYCKKAVEAHGGSISCDSEIGKGTTFTIKIPQKSMPSIEALQSQIPVEPKIQY